VTANLFAGDELVGEVAGVVYADDRTGFGVIELVRDDSGDWARCVGPLADLVEGQTVRLVGRWTEHARYGTTFDAMLYDQVTPTTEAGLRTFLTSERFAEIPARAIDRVLTTFGVRVGDVIEREPQRLTAEADLDPDVAERLRSAWEAGRTLARLVELTAPAKLPMDVVRAAHAHFGPGSDTVLTEDPYALLEVDRARFGHADALARALGIAPTDPRRLAAGARAAVVAARRQDGHQVLRRADCVEAAARLLGVDTIAAADGLERAIAAGVLDEDRVHTSRDVPVAGPPVGAPVRVVSTPAGLRAEKALTGELVRLMTADGRLANRRGDLALSDELTDGQREAIATAFRSPVSVLTGGPGTGKTRSIEELVRAAEDLGANVALCAPTGRAAKRIEEVVGHPATTVHRLLEARPTASGGFVFTYGVDDRLPHDLIVCDEVSMCDTSLARSLIAAVADGAHLVLVGDPDQLPSVGPGDVLRDLLRSDVVPVTTLTEIHRQAAASRIVGLAREVNAGVVPELVPVDGDVFLAEERQRGRIVPRVVQAVADRAPDYFGVAVEDVQVVAPVYRGPCGVDALNAALKERLNPDAGQLSVAGLQVGDRVMQTRNDADLDVSNGDVGTVVDVGRGKLRVAFPRGEVTYDKDQARDLTHAWAITVHKSQGGEWPVVVLVCDRSHRAMLWRNLVYTAITRAARALIVVGQADAVRTAAAHDRPSNRQTTLAWRLRDALGPA
jgi:exodeoxyribonuclease V alpha subunit